jgi:hypothetical protein
MKSSLFLPSTSSPLTTFPTPLRLETFVNLNCNPNSTLALTRPSTEVHSSFTHKITLSAGAYSRNSTCRHAAPSITNPDCTDELREGRLPRTAEHRPRQKVQRSTSVYRSEQSVVQHWGSSVGSCRPGSRTHERYNVVHRADPVPKLPSRAEALKGPERRFLNQSFGAFWGTGTS